MQTFKRISLTGGGDTLAAAMNTTAFINETGEVWVTGCYFTGSDSVHSFNLVALPEADVQVSVGEGALAVIGESGRFWLHDSGDSAMTMVHAELPEPVKQVSVHQRHTAVVTMSGDLWLCVDSTRKHFARVDYVPKMRQVSVGYSHAVAVDERGRLWLRGSNYHWQLGLAESGTFDDFFKIELAEPVKQVSAGRFHTVVLTVSGALYVTGRNNKGQLGLGHTEDAYGFTRAVLPAVRAITSVTTGEYHTALLTEGGGLWVSGYNQQCQLGSPGAAQYITGLKVVAAGHQHTVVMTTNGALWGCGANNHNQLGLAGERYLRFTPLGFKARTTVND